MDYKYISWAIIILCFLLHIFGIFLCLTFLLLSIVFWIGFLTIIYLQHNNELNHFLDENQSIKNPLEEQKCLGLNLVDYDKKPIVLLSPNVNVQMESKKLKISSSSDTRKKSLIDSGIELLFKKHIKTIKDGHLIVKSSSAMSPSSTSLSLSLSSGTIGTNSTVGSSDSASIGSFDTAPFGHHQTCKTNSEFYVDSNEFGAHHHHHHNHQQSDGHHPEERRWKPFESIKIYTQERKKSHDIEFKGDVQQSGEEWPIINSSNISICSGSKNSDRINSNLTTTTNTNNVMPNYKLHTDAEQLDEFGSPKHKKVAMLSGHKQIDQLLHTIITYILRDYIDSWFCSLSDNKEFSEFRTRNCIEESLQNICLRIKSVQWTPLLTTKLIDQMATHSKLYRLANQSLNSELHSKHKQNSQKLSASPQRSMGHTSNTNNNSNSNNYNIKKSQHRRNKSDTDLNWYAGSGGQTAIHNKNVANSKFHHNHPIDELLDPETKLLNAFFMNCDQFKNECLDERALEHYLTRIMETILYFSLPEEDFACLPLRTFLGTLLANVVLKPLLEMLSDPDFLNLQVARLFAKELPTAEFFIKLIRQCTDLSELRACRQLLTKEMDAKFHDANSTAELTSLKYTQNIIDIRISHLQNNKSHMNRYDNPNNKDKQPMSNLPILTLDELLTKELALSYYLDYLSILNLQKYVIFYLTAQEWKASTGRCLIDLQTNKIKGSRDELLQTLREKATYIYKEYLIQPSTNCLNIDQGLIEALNIKLKDYLIQPDCTWFESICKYVYEKIKNEDVFLINFYHSSGYKKLLLELEYFGQNNETIIDIDPALNLQHLNINFDTGSDSNSGDILFDDEQLSDFSNEFDGGGGGGGGGGVVVTNPVTINSTSGGSPTTTTSNLTTTTTTIDGVNHSRNKIMNNKDLINEKTGNIIGTTFDLSILPILNTKNTVDSSVPPTEQSSSNSLLDAINFKHSRSHSDCTGILSDRDMDGNSLKTLNETFLKHNQNNNNNNNNADKLKHNHSNNNNNNNNTPWNHHHIENPSDASQKSLQSHSVVHDHQPPYQHHHTTTQPLNVQQQQQQQQQQLHEKLTSPPQKNHLSAKIINTAIHCEGQYAVYAIQVHLIEDNQQKSWHIYRRYSKFLELKKILSKKYPLLSKIPFPAKRAFQNTQRSVLEHRMYLLNEFLIAICHQADYIEDINVIIRDFLEPDTNDKRIHGGAVIRTIETLVNPFKSGIRTIKNMPDTLVGGIAKILLGRTAASSSSSSSSSSALHKDSSFLDVAPIHLEQSSEYPALTSALNLLDEVFDLQARSQWLRRGIINRVLGAPWVSHTANKRIIHAAKSLIEIDKIEQLLSVILNSIWPNGEHPQKSITREDNTKLRTRMAAKMALFTLLSDDLKHVVGSETTRFGLLNCFSMWQHKKLNLRLALVLLNDLLTTLYQIDDLTKHFGKRK